MHKITQYENMDIHSVNVNKEEFILHLIQHVPHYLHTYTEAN